MPEFVRSARLSSSLLLETTMTRAQRGILIIYCLLVVYCCIWVPWHYDQGEFKAIKEGYGLIWDGPPEGVGVPDLAAIASRVLAMTGLGAAAFLLAGKWKALVFITVLAGSGILVYRSWNNMIVGRRTQKIHECAIAKVASAKCTPPDNGGFRVCDPYALPDNPTAQQENALIQAAEEECAASMRPKQKSAHEQIEDYKRLHGLNE